MRLFSPLTGAPGAPVVVLTVRAEAQVRLPGIPVPQLLRALDGVVREDRPQNTPDEVNDDPAHDDDSSNA